jgi:hypothetical protein
LKPRLANAAIPGLALFLLGGALQAQGFSSLHWKSTSQITGGPQGDMTTESELWMKAKKVRVKTKAMGMDLNIVKSDDVVYQWQEGQPSGMKMSASMPRRGGGSMEYVDKMEEIRTKGKKVGTETVDGHSCDVYEYTETGGHNGEMKQKYWMARDLKNFPVKVVSESGSTKITTSNHDIDLSASVPDSMVTPPDNVKFQDMTEMMKGMAPKS